MIAILEDDKENCVLLESLPLLELQKLHSEMDFFFSPHSNIANLGKAIKICIANIAIIYLRSLSCANVISPVAYNFLKVFLWFAMSLFDSLHAFHTCCARSPMYSYLMRLCIVIMKSNTESIVQIVVRMPK